MCMKVSSICLMLMQYWLGRNSRCFLAASSPYFRPFCWRKDDLLPCWKHLSLVPDNCKANRILCRCCFYLESLSGLGPSTAHTSFLIHSSASQLPFCLSHPLSTQTSSMLRGCFWNRIKFLTIALSDLTCVEPSWKCSAASRQTDREPRATLLLITMNSLLTSSFPIVPCCTLGTISLLWHEYMSYTMGSQWLSGVGLLLQ